MLDSVLRRLLTFRCEDATCAATLDEADGAAGILFVTGGREPRAGAHGWQAALARSLAEAGHPVLRFDRRGVGDSDGADTGNRASGPDIAAAARCLRLANPSIKRLIGVGNCDGATALSLHHEAAMLAGVILLNPWLGDDEGDDLPPAAAIRRRYRARLFSPRAWLRLLTGRIDLRAAASGLRKAATAPVGSDAAHEMATSLGAVPARIILSSDDATAIAFAAAWRTRRERSATPPPVVLPTRSHSFADEGDGDRLVAACLDAIRTIERG